MPGCRFRIGIVWAFLPKTFGRLPLLTLSSPMTYKIAAYASAALLLLALADWPYGFYTFLRIAVCITSVFGAIRAFSTDTSGWGVTLAAIAILFNPVIPVYLSQAAWAPIDVVCAGLVGVSPHHVSVGGETPTDSSTASHP